MLIFRIKSDDLHVIQFMVLSFFCQSAEMLSELSRRERAANIKPDPDVDIFMKVRKKLLHIYMFVSVRRECMNFSCPECRGLVGQTSDHHLGECKNFMLIFLF